MYLILFSIGLFGLLTLTALGFLSHGGGHDHGGHGHGNGHGHAHMDGGHGVAHSAHGAHATAPTTDASSVGSLGSRGFHARGHRGSVKGGGVASLLWVLLSPMEIFSLCFGAGATGLLLQPKLDVQWLPWIALLGALVFNFGVVRPFVGWLAKFASNPSDGLEGLVSKSGTAVTRFDDHGRGLVNLTLDGQGIQVLATLDRDEWSRGVLVAKGDSVTILEVDATKNTCRVTRELAA